MPRRPARGHRRCRHVPRRTRGQVIKDGKTYEHLDIFQAFYLNGQSEELELDEIASSLEPRQDMSDAPDGLSALELARRALRREVMMSAVLGTKRLDSCREQAMLLKGSLETLDYIIQ